MKRYPWKRTESPLPKGDGGWRRPLSSGAAALLSLALTACGSGDPTATDPTDVFADGFESPPAQAVIEAEGGTMVRGYDAWLKILPQGELSARYEADYCYIDCAAPRAFFNRVLHSEELAPRHAHLDCLGYSDSRFDFDNGRWLVHNRTDGRWYFRVWKHYSDR